MRSEKSWRCRCRIYSKARPEDGKARTNQTSNTLLELLGTREGQSLVANFARITDVDSRRGFVGLIEKVAALGDNRPPKPKRSRPKKK
jgi:hypothetical protein